MSFGIQVYDASGNQLVDVADSVMTILGTFSRTFSGQNYSEAGNFFNAEFARGTPFAIISKYPIQICNPNEIAVTTISFSGNSCIWTVEKKITFVENGNVNIQANRVSGNLVFIYGYF